MDERKRAILSLIAEQPNIRLVEISDKLDIDMERVQPLIQAEIDAGTIITEQIQAPNLRWQPAFRYKSADIAKPAHDQAVIDVPVTRKLDPVPEVIKPVTESEVRAPTPKKNAEAPRVRTPLSKIDIAINFLRQQAGAGVTTEDMRKALGLTNPNYAIGAFIRPAIRDGRIRQVNGIWSLGSDPEQSHVEKPAAGINIDAAHAQPDHVAVRPLRVSPTPTATAAQLPAEDKPALPSHDAERFVAGLLSSGELQLSIDGKTLTLTPAYTRELYQYLNKIGPVMLA